MRANFLSFILLASLGTASNIPYQRYKRYGYEVKNSTSVEGVSPSEGLPVPSGSSVPAPVGTGSSIALPTAASSSLIDAPVSSINASNFNISTTFVATQTSTSLATSTEVVETTLLITNGTATSVIPTTLVVTSTHTVLVYYTPGPNGDMTPASTAAPVVTKAAESVELSVTESVGSTVLTYTQGAGASASKVVTTVKVTKTLTMTRTRTSTEGSSDAIPTANAVGKASEDSSEDGESTVTVKQTRTHTTTAFRSGSSSSVVAAAGSGNEGGVFAEGSATGSGSDCGAAVTKTVTEKSTVYVTATPSSVSVAPVLETPTISADSISKPFATPSGYFNTTTPFTNGTAGDAPTPSKALGTGMMSIGTAPASTAPASISLIDLATRSSPPVSTIFAGDLSSSAASAVTPEPMPYYVRRMKRDGRA